MKKAEKDDEVERSSSSEESSGSSGSDLSGSSEDSSDTDSSSSSTSSSLSESDSKLNEEENADKHPEENIDSASEVPVYTTNQRDPESKGKEREAHTSDSNAISIEQSSLEDESEEASESGSDPEEVHLKISEDPSVDDKENSEYEDNDKLSDNLSDSDCLEGDLNDEDFAEEKQEFESENGEELVESSSNSDEYDSYTDEDIEIDVDEDDEILLERPSSSIKHRKRSLNDVRKRDEEDNSKHKFSKLSVHVALYTQKVKTILREPVEPYALEAMNVLSEDIAKLKRVGKEVREYGIKKSLKSENSLLKRKESVISCGRLFSVLVLLIITLSLLMIYSGVTDFLPGFGPPKLEKELSVWEDYDKRWERTSKIDWQELLEIIPKVEHKIDNRSSVRVKKLPQLSPPLYIGLKSSELVQIKRPAVRKMRPDEPRATRTFGCVRDGCRGLAIEDMLDRGWQMRFRASMVNDTFKNINYRVTILMTDTTYLNKMRKERPDLLKRIYESYEGKCYLTAFDGADAIGGNKGMQLSIKQKFSRKYGCKFNELAIAPSTYRLYNEEECNDLLRTGSLGLTYLLKPETGSQGAGISFHTHPTSIEHKVPQFFPCSKKKYKATDRYLVQEYIEKPLLLKKSKFDVRIYMMIASSSPYLVFYHEGYLRRALAEYSPMSKDRKVYLTNTHFQSMKKGFKLSDHIWPFSTFQEYLSERGRAGGHYVESVLNPYLKKVALYIFQSARPKLIKRKGAFHIFGIDFMIDANWHVWYIEANGYPGFTWSINFDTRTMVEEHYNLAQQVHENPRFYTLMESGDRYGGFEMLFNELEEEKNRIAYNPCYEFKYNRGFTKPLKAANRLFAKISGKGGRTDKLKAFSNRIPGGEKIGGHRGLSIQVQRKLFDKHSCSRDTIRYFPRTYLLYSSRDCRSFFESPDKEEDQWVLKPVESLGGEGVQLFMNKEDLKERFGACNQRPPDFIVQKFIQDRVLFGDKWYDMKVFMLIANTRPFMVFYHRGFLRSARLIVNKKSSTDVEESLNENPLADLVADEGTQEGEEKEPGETEEPNESKEAAETESNTGILDINSPSEIDEKESWEPKELATGGTWELGEHFLSFEEFQDEMAKANLIGSQYVHSIFDTYMKKLLLMVFHSAKDDLNRTGHAYQLIQLNMIIDKKFTIHFIGSKTIDPDASFPNIENFKEQKASLMETMAQLVLEVQELPSAFVRMRRGDSYANWRLVYSEMEDKQRDIPYDPCEIFRRNLMVTKGSIYKNAWLHNYAEKRHAANKRELNKYINNKWQTCKHRPTKEMMSSCIRNTISYRYKIYIQKEKMEYQDGYVENRIRDLIAKREAEAKGG